MALGMADGLLLLPRKIGRRDRAGRTAMANCRQDMFCVPEADGEWVSGLVDGGVLAVSGTHIRDG